MKNRLESYFDATPEETKTEKSDVPHASCVIVSDEKQDRVIVSFRGEKLLWHWKTYPNGSYGLECPGAPESVKMDPLAAEAFVEEEISQFLSIEGIGDDEIIYVDSTGTRVEGVRLNPPQLGEMTFELLFKKEKLKELYDMFLSHGDSLTEEIVGEAISAGVLKALLSLVNLE